jgi:hypothetical protein
MLNKSSQQRRNWINTDNGSGSLANKGETESTQIMEVGEKTETKSWKLSEKLTGHAENVNLNDLSENIPHSFHNL